MHAATDTERFRRALVPVIAVLLGAGVIAAATHRAPDDPAGRSSVEAAPEGSTAPPPSATGGDGVPSVAPEDSSSASATSTTQPPVLGPASVPEPGVYRYEVDAVRDGEPSSRSEEREITVVGEEGASSIVQIVARSEGERQVSVLDWSPEGVLVRSTRIETDEGATRDCTWDPSFPEFGRLVVDASWTLGSTCSTEVAGLATEFVVTGSGRVAGRAEVVHGGRTVHVWQVERDRTTTITATVGADSVEQVVREVGTFFVDPARGLVLRSDVTLTQSGTQQGTTRRTSVLTEG
ncbi:hypothetical protein [Actinospongicola halichondriae]|uniref:hypothetical protein n=1 Tax=Actinospongicola halichondriae TaxID=3236844 RepID=UPI003D58D20F